MAGLYIHIPFCESRCAYCDFFSTTQKESIPSYIYALETEIVQKKEWLKGETIDTIYFGGGTPSTLERKYLMLLLDQIKRCFTLNPYAEITIEVNPDDISKKYVQTLFDLKFNRVSIGIQSLNNDILKLIGRRHSSKQAINAVRNFLEVGFKNISIDLIYGIPGQTTESFIDDIYRVLSLDVTHISTYHLSYKKDTKMARLKKQGKITPISENSSRTMYDTLCRIMRESGFVHYEISSFCKPGMVSKHNSNYWNGTNYLGVGAGAHSYNGEKRCWNISNLDLYIEGIIEGKRVTQEESLSCKDRMNEMLMLSLRTLKGLDMDLFVSKFGDKSGKSIMINAEKYINAGSLLIDKGVLKFTEQDLFVSDNIISDLFF